MRALLLWLLGTICAALVLPTACGPSLAEDYDVFVAPDVPNDWVEEAVEEWSTFTSARFTLHPGVWPAECWRDCIAIRLGTAADACGGEYGKAGCEWGQTAHEIWVLGDLGDEGGRACMTHEVGHALGLVHHPDAFAVMHPGLGVGAWHVTCDDIWQYMDLRGQSMDFSQCTDARLWSAMPLDLVARPSSDAGAK